MGGMGAVGFRRLGMLLGRDDAALIGLGGYSVGKCGGLNVGVGVDGSCLCLDCYAAPSCVCGDCREPLVGF